MSEEITVRFKWTADEQRTAMKYAYHAQYPRIVRVLFWPALWLTALVGTIITVRFGTESNGFLPMVTGATALLCCKFVVPWMQRRQFLKDPHTNAEIEWRITAGEVKVKTPKSSAEHSWPAFSKVVQTKNGFLFFLSPRIFNWLPRTGFGSDSDFERLSKLAEKNAKHFTRVA